MIRLVPLILAVISFFLVWFLNPCYPVLALATVGLCILTLVLMRKFKP